MSFSTKAPSQLSGHGLRFDWYQRKTSDWACGAGGLLGGDAGSRWGGHLVVTSLMFVLALVLVPQSHARATDEFADYAELVETLDLDILAEQADAFDFERVKEHLVTWLELLEIQANLEPKALGPVFQDWVEAERERNEQISGKLTQFAVRIYSDELRDLSESEFQELMRFTRSETGMKLARANARIIGSYLDYRPLTKHPAFLRLGRNLIPVLQEHFPAAPEIDW